MSKNAEKKSFLTDILAWIERFWLIAVFSMILTFLTSLDTLFTLTNILSLILEEWRSFLHWTWESLVNIPLRLINKGPVDIPSPWPEFATFLTMLVFTSLKKNKIEQTEIAKWLLHKNWELRDYFSKNLNFEKLKISALLFFLAGNFLGIVVLFWPYILVGYIIFAASLSLTETLFLICIPVLAMLSIGGLWKSKYEETSEILELHGYVVLPVVILGSFAILILVATLETLIPSFWAFVETAKVSD